MVRVGSRSKNETLAQCNIKNKRVRRSSQLQRTYSEFRTQKTRFVKTNHIEDMSRALSRSRTMLLHHDTSGLFTDYPEFYNQLDDLAGDLEDGGKDPNLAVNQWLEEDDLSASLAQMDLSDDYQMQAVSEETTELINVEGEAERELENRMLDLDEEDEFTRHIRKYSYMSKLRLNNSKQPEVDEDGFQKVTSRKSNNGMSRRDLENKMNSIDEMTEVEVSKLRSLVNDGSLDITSGLPVEQRWRLYKHLLSQYTDRISSNMGLLHERYKTITGVDEDIKMQTNIATLKEAKVIGMTTTGAARLQSVLQQVGPEIVVVEEAAEVLEAHIITALNKHCKHLILIGDHKQLKPNPTVYDLAKNYNLDLSLFERMVNNGLPVKTLNIQHRMRPEVSKYIRGHIYDRLDDHPTVCGREAIRGVAQPVFFFNHNNKESEMAGLMSKCNEFEAEMIVKFTSYLVRQNYSCEQITVITMYKGQELDIRKRMRSQGELEGLKVCTVDSYQGEENDIIIISLVRSNNDDKLGFIEIDNRVCVTLSRAKLGMYVFGNLDMIGKNSKLWANLITEAKKAGEYGEEINLSCVRHKSPATASKPDDFYTKAPLGGCTKPCNEVMKCGHSCPHQCHYTDRHHVRVMCREPCIATCVRGHPCKGKVCGGCQHFCKEPHSQQLPCSHSLTAVCHKWDGFLPPPCDKLCEKTLDCGHVCKDLCKDPCPRCTQLIEKMCSRCGEITRVPCLSTTFQCKTPCEEILACGHNCPGNCSDCETEGNPAHQKCRVVCGKYLSCGHECRGLCGDCEPECKDICKEKCLLKCSHGTKCSTTCADVCQFEEKKRPCDWSCDRHGSCPNPCGSPCSNNMCAKQCEREIKCGSCNEVGRCQGLCGQPHILMCKRCKLPGIIEQLKKLPSPEPKSTDPWLILADCRHHIPVEYMDDWVFTHQDTLPIFCPYTDCQQPVLNTGRYVNITRREKHRVDKERQFSPPEFSMAADWVGRSSTRSSSPTWWYDSGRRREISRSTARGENMHHTARSAHYASDTRKRDSHRSVHTTRYGERKRSLSPLSRNRIKNRRGFRPRDTEKEVNSAAEAQLEGQKAILRPSIENNTKAHVSKSERRTTARDVGISLSAS